MKKIAAGLLALICLTTHAQIKDIPFGKDNHILYDLDKGTYDVVFNGQEIIHQAYAVCRSADRTDSSTAYAHHTFNFLKGSLHMSQERYIIRSTGLGLPDMEQEFAFPNYGFSFVTEVRLAVPGCNYMSPLTTQQAGIHQQEDNRALMVPFDNDAWVRYNAASLQLADMTSSEVTALYSNTSRHGLIIGSLSQTAWKTGIRIKGAEGGKIVTLSAFGGYTDKHYTHDNIGHGLVKAGPQGVTVSPSMMVGWFDDWRSGLDFYSMLLYDEQGKYVKYWEKGTPFGWNSWGAMQDKLSLPKVKAVVDFFHDSCKVFRTEDKTLYVDLDSYWDILLKGGLNGDYSQLKEFCDYCKKKGFQPGIYWAPFVDWGKSPRKMEGSEYDYQDCWIKQKGQFNDLDGARALDPTHPGTKARIALVIGKFKECGFKMIKIDFLGHASLEADHFYDTTVHTGMQAFNQGMKYLVQQLDNKMLIYAAISPNLATAPYVHMRRIACDAYSNISETGYTLNSTTYGWWQSKLYDHIDADHIVFKTESAGANRARLTSALVTGTLITGDDYSVPGQWHATAQQLLQNKDLLEVAAKGRAFRPLEGNTGDKPGNFFIRKDAKHTYLAIVNYDQQPLEYTIDPARWEINTKAMKELFSGAQLRPGALKITVPPADAVIYRMD